MDTKANDWQDILTKNLLGIFLTDNSNTNQAFYPYTFLIDDAVIFVMTADSHQFDTDLTKAQIFDLLLQQHQNFLNHIPKHWQNKLSFVKTQHPNKYDDAHLPKVYFIAIVTDGLLSCIDFNDKKLEQQSFFTDKTTLLQVLSWQDWQAMLDILPSPTDVLAFLKYHRQALLTSTPFDNVTTLVYDFLHDPVYFQRAWRVEKELLKQDFMVRVSIPIKEAIYKKYERIKTLVAHQIMTSPLWTQAVLRMKTRQENAGFFVPDWLIQKLLWQCGYTRMSIVDAVLGFQNLSFDEKQIGKVSHVHSYHRLGQHFVVVIYGQDPKSDLHANNIVKVYEAILQNVDEQLLAIPMQDLFLLGFDLSKTDESGNIHVLMDVYYMPSRQHFTK